MLNKKTAILRTPMSMIHETENEKDSPRSTIKEQRKVQFKFSDQKVNIPNDYDEQEQDNFIKYR